MQDIVRQLLDAAGLSIPDDHFVQSMNDWLLLSTSDVLYEGLTAEDAPLDPHVDVLWRRLAVETWQLWPQRHMATGNPLLDESIADQTGIDLSQVFGAVQVVEWLYAYAQLSTSTTTGDHRPGLARVVDKAWVAALFYHIQELPNLQAYILQYAQHLQQPPSRNKNRPSQLDAPTRLAQYERGNHAQERLSNQLHEHLKKVEYLLGQSYALGDVNARQYIRKQLGVTWQRFVLQQHASGGIRSVNTWAVSISMTLKVLYRILLGVSSPTAAHADLLLGPLMDLHRPDALVLWRDQTPILELYHEPLTRCVAVLLQKSSRLIPEVVQGLCKDERIFPKAGNTPKQVLLLHELDTFLGLLPLEDGSLTIGGTWWPTVLSTVSRCMASPHTRVAQRALQFFRNKTWECLVQAHLESSLRTVLPFLVQSEPSWNPTVRKMTYNVLRQLQGYDEALMESVCERIFAEPVVASAPTKSKPKPPSIPLRKNPERVIPQSSSLTAGMNGWRPNLPPSMNQGGSMPPPKVRPPLTVTGVAPWAMQRPAPRAQIPVERSSLGSLSEETDLSLDDIGIALTGYRRVNAYMATLKPDEEDEGASSWSKAQMAETPTLLPDLKFHDLVFGQELGAGAFGSVKYARLIDRDKTRSHWAEYAVKIVSTEKIREMEYEASIQREIAVLRVLSHPSIARLVSSFRFRDGAYLVLEYASGGDLHTLLKNHGSLDTESTRFVIGELIAALCSIHELELVYGDLKPENVCVSETGHIKLTDFGGCRPVSDKARALIAASSKDILKNMRDGDWKPSSKDESDEMSVGGGSSAGKEVNDDEEDLRIEGTTAYLPPEVVMGGIPTYAADSWALGCVLYQCLCGRPPLLETDEEATRARIVTFDSQQSSNELTRLFEDKHASHMLPEAKALVSSLLGRAPSSRPSMHAAAQHDFFEGVDVFGLHKGAPVHLDVGQVAPKSDARWSQRQFSSIWAPQPKDYDISLPNTTSTVEEVTSDWSTAPIMEEDEASGPFAAGPSSGPRLPPSLGRLSERNK